MDWKLSLERKNAEMIEKKRKRMEGKVLRSTKKEMGEKESERKNGRERERVRKKEMKL